MTTTIIAKRTPQNGAAIREIRIREGLSRKAVAERCAISESHLRNIENEHKTVSIEVLARIAASLSCSLASIRREPAA